MVRDFNQKQEAADWAHHCGKSEIPKGKNIAQHLTKRRKHTKHLFK